MGSLVGNGLFQIATLKIYVKPDLDINDFARTAIRRVDISFYGCALWPRLAEISETDMDSILLTRCAKCAAAARTRGSFVEA